MGFRGNPGSRIGRLPMVSASVLAAAAIVSLARPSAQTFRSGTYTVQVTVTVTDTAGRLVPGLGASEFTVFEDGERQPVTQFSDERVPVSLGVMLDASDSMRGTAIVDARLAVDRFVADLLEPGDQAFVGTFNHRPQIVVPWTRPPLAVARAAGGRAPFGWHGHL